MKKTIKKTLALVLIFSLSASNTAFGIWPFSKNTQSPKSKTRRAWDFTSKTAKGTVKYLWNTNRYAKAAIAGFVGLVTAGLWAKNYFAPKNEVIKSQKDSKEENINPEEIDASKEASKIENDEQEEEANKSSVSIFKVIKDIMFVKPKSYLARKAKGFLSVVNPANLFYGPKNNVENKGEAKKEKTSENSAEKLQKENKVENKDEAKKAEQKKADAEGGAKQPQKEENKDKGKAKTDAEITKDEQVKADEKHAKRIQAEQLQKETEELKRQIAEAKEKYKDYKVQIRPTVRSAKRRTNGSCKGRSCSRK